MGSGDCHPCGSAVGFPQENLGTRETALGFSLSYLSHFSRGQEILELCCGWKRSARKWLEPTRTQTQLREVNGLGRGTKAERREGTAGSTGAQIIRWTPSPFQPLWGSGLVSEREVSCSDHRMGFPEVTGQDNLQG